MRSVVCRLALATATVVTLLAPAVAMAGTPVEEGVKYLETVQKKESATGAPSFGGDWALTSLAAAGKPAAEVIRGSGTTNAREWYEKYIAKPSSWPGEPEDPATEYEKATLVSYAAGIEPSRVSVEQNLFADLFSEYQTASPGYYGLPGHLEGTIFGVLALADTKIEGVTERIPSVLLQQSVEVIEKNQHNDGGWNYEQVEGSKEGLESKAEPDTTGAAIAALCTSGIKNEAEEHSLTKGEEYLKSILPADGGFESEFGANADSNAWAVQGLNACEINAGEFLKAPGDESPVKFLERLQITGATNKGGFVYELGGKTVENYSSQDAVRALAKGGFTAVAPKPKSGERWNHKSEFSTTEISHVGLIVNNGSSLKVCSVPVKAESEGEKTSIPLLQVLTKAKSSGVPACVSSFEPSSGTGAVTSVNGTAAAWKVSLNNGSEKTAELSTQVELGAVIYLNG